MLNAMFRLAIAGFRANRLRTLLTGLAVMLGVGLLGGCLIYGDTAKAAFFDDLARGAVGVDVLAKPVGKEQKLTERSLATMAGLPGVAHADGRLVAPLGLLDERGRALANGGSVGYAMSLPGWPGFSRFRLVAGRLPSSTGETALDAPTADREHLKSGDTVRVVGPDAQPRQLTVVGIVDLGTTVRFADASVVVLTNADFLALTTPPATDAAPDMGFDEIVLAAAPGVSPDVLRQRVLGALGPGYEVDTGDTVRHAAAVASAKYVDGFLTALLASSLIALVVAGLVVYNTFRILVAQRIRHLALLRCVGAGRGQIIGLVLAESLMIGALAAIGSVVVSGLAGLSLLVGQDTFGRGIPEYHLVISPLTVAAPLVAGLAVTIFSSVLPALTAGRVSPLAALGSSAEAWRLPEPGGIRRAVTAFAALLLAGAGFALVQSGRGSGFDGLLAMVAGAMVVFLAVVALMPLMVTMISRPLRWTLGRMFGVPGRLATGNASRNPVRFAATATALMIGIAPLTTFAVVLTTARVQADRELAENFPIDFVVHPADVVAEPRRLPGPLIQQIRDTKEFGAVTLTRVANGDAAGAGVQIAAAEPGSIGSRVNPEIMAGNLANLRPGTVALRVGLARDHGLDIGDRTVVGPWGATWDVTVVALFDDTPILGDALVDWSDFTQHMRGDDYLLIRRADAVSAADASKALDAATADDPLAVSSSVAQRRESLADSLGRRLAQFNVLIGMSLLIAVLGIGNTLSLAVLERTPELALLRALGLGRTQVYRMLLIEALLIALVGAQVGVLFGVSFGWLIAHELINRYGHGSADIPWPTIAAYVGLSAAAGAIASVLPARRAAGAAIVEALPDT